jgi:hypothetical protein
VFILAGAVIFSKRGGVETSSESSQAVQREH